MEIHQSSKLWEINQIHNSFQMCTKVLYANFLSLTAGAHNEKERLTLNTVREPTFRPSMPK